MVLTIRYGKKGICNSSDLSAVARRKYCQMDFRNKESGDASRGYFLGARLLDFLAPDNGQEKLVVPVSTEVVERKEKDGFLIKIS